ncbi:hypothetical protein N0V94_000814 [Neodidymelliopsis sp. IMI 364377]|nr:hypothetical protein N0V94_000814 [Neodidymelliopsis sp. IMI 364377]
MPPKKDTLVTDTITGYDAKETRILAAAFYDYATFAHLSGFTEGTLKKFWPPIKKKAMENHESFGKFLGAAAPSASTTKAATGGRKRKEPADADADADVEVGATDDKKRKSKSASAEPTAAAAGAKKKAPAKGKRGKKVKTEEIVKEEEENSADGGDGMGEFVFKRNVVEWLEKTDGFADADKV